MRQLAGPAAALAESSSSWVSRLGRGLQKLDVQFKSGKSKGSEPGPAQGEGEPAGPKQDPGASSSGNGSTAAGDDPASGPFRGSSQGNPGGQNGPPVSINKLKMAVGRAGMSVSQYDVEHVPTIPDADGGLAFGSSPTNGAGASLTGSRGRPLIQISDRGLSNMDEAVATLFHEVGHHMVRNAFGREATESEAEAFGQRMLALFRSRTVGSQ